MQRVQELHQSSAVPGCLKGLWTHLPWPWLNLYPHRFPSFSFYMHRYVCTWMCKYHLGAPIETERYACFDSRLCVFQSARQVVTADRMQWKNRARDTVIRASRPVDNGDLPVHRDMTFAQRTGRHVDRITRWVSPMHKVAFRICVLGIRPRSLYLL